MLVETEPTLAVAAAKAGIDERTARKHRRLGKLPSELPRAHQWRTRLDPFEAVWDWCRGQLELEPGLQARALFQVLQRKYPGRFHEGQMRTLQRRVKTWRASEGPGKEVLLSQVHTPGRPCPSSSIKLSKMGTPCHWMLRLLQGRLTAQLLAPELGASMSPDDIAALVRRISNGPLRARNRAATILASVKGIPLRAIARFLMIDPRVVKRYMIHYERGGIGGLFARRKGREPKHEQPSYKEAVFSLLHSPPKVHGINRTSWCMPDLTRLLRQQGLLISQGSIRRIIRDAGFRFRSAKRVLTSTDPQYREKLAEITKILANLTDNQKFFSIDEFGPFAVKICGGRALTAPGEQRVVPQWQKSKGHVTLVGALELSTNQMIHFYADRKSTAEMIKLMHILLSQYRDQSVLYLSWDAASWHASKAFVEEVARVNGEQYRRSHHSPTVTLVPLPACAQFLNVIESVFSGMARAIIHNSDYDSVGECMVAIDRYYRDRNQFFREHPKRAGNKIWGKERVPPVFSPSNNCKDPRWR